MQLLSCIFGGGARVLSNFPPKNTKHLICIVYIDLKGVWRLLRTFALVLNFRRGGAQCTLQISPEKSNESNLNWVHGFHRVLAAFWNFAYAIAFLHFWEGGAQGTSHFFSEKSKQLRSALGTLISQGFGGFFLLLLMN